MSGLPVTDLVLIVDFGGQFTQLIARRVREANVYSEIVPYTAAEKALAELRPKAIILSGGPASVLDEGAPQVPECDVRGGRAGAGHLLRPAGHGAPLGGVVQPGASANTARRSSRSAPGSPLFEGVGAAGDTRAGVDEPRRPGRGAAAEGFAPIATSRNAPFAAIADEKRRLLRRAVPSRGGAHAAAARRCCATSCTRSRAAARTGRWPPSARRDRAHPRAGRRRAG